MGRIVFTLLLAAVNVWIALITPLGVFWETVHWILVGYCLFWGGVFFKEEIDK